MSTADPNAGPADARKRVHARQDLALANYFAATRTRLETVRNDATVSALLAARGFDAAAFDEGLGLVGAAEDAYAARQKAIGDEAKVFQAVVAARKAAHLAFKDFRDIAAAAYPAKDPNRAVLGATGRFPMDDDRFLTAARTAYALAVQAPHAAVLARFGLDSAAVTSALETVNDFDTVRATVPLVVDQARTATAVRNAAAAEIKQWMRPFDRIAALIVRSHPELRSRLFS